MTKKTVIGPSGASFAQNGVVIAETPTACPRRWLAKKNGFRTEIDALYGAMGELDEHRWKTKHLRENPDHTIETQIEINHDLSPHLAIKGYIDAKLTTPEGSKLVEKKSHISKSQRLAIIRKQTPKMAHVAQLSTYLVTQKMTDGVIINDYYEFDKECLTLTNTEGYQFDITLNGRSIEVNGEPYQYDLDNLAEFYKIMNAAVTNDSLPSRPRPVNLSDRKPCVFCPLKDICDQADIERWDKELFLDKVNTESERLIREDTEKRKPAQIWAPSLRRKKKND